MEKVLLKRSKKGLWVQIIVAGILALILIIFAVFVLGKLLGWTPNEGQYIKAGTTLLIIGGWAISSLKLWADWNVKKYEITDDSFIVHGKAGRWGSSQAIYRYESIISIKMTQGFWGKKYNYGDVRLTIPKLEKDIVMYDIIDPLDQLAAVQKRINDRSQANSTLIT